MIGRRVRCRWPLALIIRDDGSAREKKQTYIRVLSTRIFSDSRRRLERANHLESDLGLTRSGLLHKKKSDATGEPSNGCTFSSFSRGYAS